MILFILLIFIQTIVADQFVFSEYTHVAKTFSGAPCLTGCDANFECVVNWKWEKANCRTFELAPIYRTSRQRDPLRKYCLSNCGYFGESYEWCITTDDLKWDFCSSYESKTFLNSLDPVAQTRYGVTCTESCRWYEDGVSQYYWCRYLSGGQTKWEYCAPPALPRVPVLRDGFEIGQKKKGNCDGLLKYMSFYTNPLTAVDAADNFVTDLADAIEGSAINQTFTKIYKVVDQAAVDSYATVKIKSIRLPVVIRAHITNVSIEINDNSSISAEVDRKVREQMAGSGSSYKAVRLISGDLGGPNAEYNIVPRSVNWECDEWYDMEEAVRSWCHNTGGSVDMTVVIFYKGVDTPIPHAFGVSLVYRNSDHSLFVDCREKIHYNSF